MVYHDLLIIYQVNSAFLEPTAVTIHQILAVEGLEANEGSDVAFAWRLATGVLVKHTELVDPFVLASISEALEGFRLVAASVLARRTADGLETRLRVLGCGLSIHEVDPLDCLVLLHGPFLMLIIVANLILKGINA